MPRTPQRAGKVEGRAFEDLDHVAPGGGVGSYDGGVGYAGVGEEVERHVGLGGQVAMEEFDEAF